MGGIFTKYTFYVAVLCYAGCGMGVGQIINALIKRRFGVLYSSHPGEFWFTLLANAVALFILCVRTKGLFDKEQEREESEMHWTLLGTSFTPGDLVRVVSYVIAYLVGLGCWFFL